MEAAREGEGRMELSCELCVVLLFVEERRKLWSTGVAKTHSIGQTQSRAVKKNVKASMLELVTCDSA